VIEENGRGKHVVPTHQEDKGMMMGLVVEALLSLLRSIAVVKMSMCIIKLS
jgi:hypothetical protein